MSKYNPPYKSCIICEKSLNEVGGRRLCINDRDIPLAKTKGFSLYKKEKEIIHKGYKAWICQICADRLCSECGSPVQRPVGRDVIYDDGYTCHIAIFPPLGCTNENCSKNIKTN